VRTRFKRAPVETCEQQSAQDGSDAPPWWKPTLSPQVECYVADPFDHVLASNTAWLIYDRSTGTAHFHYVGVD
jgi:hypothetical protein